MLRRVTRVSRVLIVVAIVLTAACSDDDSSDSGAVPGADGLARAAQMSLAAESYVMTVSDGNWADAGFELTYEAPDHALVRSTDEAAGASDVYVVGQDMLVPNSAAAGRYMRYDLPEHYIDRNLQFALRLLLQAAVTGLDGDTFEFRVDAGSGELGRAVVRDGLVQEVTVPFAADGRDVEATYTFSAYGSAPAVQPPDGSLIDEGTTAPPCGDAGPDQTQVLCIDQS